MFRLGIISDTHGLLRPEVLEALKSYDHVLHIGDVGTAETLNTLQQIVPLTAVRGNVDRGAWSEVLPMTNTFSYQHFHFYLTHILEDLDIDPEAGGFSAVLYGHSHRPEMRLKGKTLYLNPGSCGPKRFDLPISWVSMNFSGNGHTLSWHFI